MDVCLLGQLFLPPAPPLHVHIHAQKKEQNGGKGILQSEKSIPLWTEDTEAEQHF